MQWINKLKKRLVPCFFFVASHAFVFAHSPTNSSSLLMQGQNGMWMLQIRAALTAFEQEVHTRYAQDSYTSPEEFKALIAHILASDIALSFNGLSPMTLQDPQIKLGHETLVFYQFKGPETMDTIQFKNESFKNIHHSKNVLFVLKNGLDKNQFYLTKDNGFTQRLTVEGSELKPIAQKEEQKHNAAGLLPAVAVILLVVLALLWVNKRQTP